MQSVNFDEEIDKIVAADPRYNRDAYIFVREALDHTQKVATKSKVGREEARHVTGKELLEGIRDYALDRYGPMAITLLEEWGIKKTGDFGDIVFNMVDCNLLGKTDQDSREDFKGGYDFFEAFRKPFLPATSLTKPSPVADQA